MSTSDQAEIFAVVALGAVLAVVLTLFILRKLGLTKFAKADERHAPLNQGLLADPRLDALSAEDRQKVLAKVRWHPLVILWLFGAIGGFAWVAIGSPDLLNFINVSARSAALVGVAVLVVVLVGLKLLWWWLIGRAIRQLPRR
jgi:hypothetical protein